MFQGNSSSGDYKKKYLIMALIIVAFIVYSFVRAGHYVTVSNTSDTELLVEAKAAKENDSAVGYLDLEEGQQLVITTNLTAGSLLVELFIEGEDGEPVLVCSETYRADDTGTVEITHGCQHALQATASAGTTGTMTVAAE